MSRPHPSWESGLVAEKIATASSGATVTSHGGSWVSPELGTPVVLDSL
jgi:hypothetical protein